jgi:hypothetical protein
MGELEIQGQNEREKLNDFYEVGETLLKNSPGLLIVDVDFTIKTKEYELGMGGKEPGRLPEKSMDLLKKMMDAGWKVRAVSNQPLKGHQVAGWVKKFKKGEYQIFPNDLINLLGNDGVDGGGIDFLWNKHKKTQVAVDRTVDWIRSNLNSINGGVHFIGDRESDETFARNVEWELKERGVEMPIKFWKVEGLRLPALLKSLEKFVP